MSFKDSTSVVVNLQSDSIGYRHAAIYAMK